MNITEITITYGRKFNLGNYEQLHIDLSLTAQLDETDDATQAQTELFSIAKSQVRGQALPVITHGKNGVVEAFLSLPEEQQNEIMDLAYSVKRSESEPTELDEYFPRNETERDYLDHGDK